MSSDTDDYFDVSEYDEWPTRPTTTSLPDDCEMEIRALMRALKATGLPLAGPMTAAAAAGVVLAELRLLGYAVAALEGAEQR